MARSTLFLQVCAMPLCYDFVLILCMLRLRVVTLLTSCYDFVHVFILHVFVLYLRLMTPLRTRAG